MVVAHAQKPPVLAAGSAEPSVGTLNDPTFITTWNCPYAQRTWLVLNEKGIKFTPVHVDLKNKPEWFFKHNEYGRVPTLVWRDEDDSQTEPHSVYESLIVNEFLEEQYPSPALLPKDAFGRARARLLIDQYGVKVAPHFGKLQFAKDEVTAKEASAALTEGLRWLETQIHPEGPFILGADFSLVDAAIIPFIIRLEVLKELRGFKVPSPQEAPRLARFTAAATSRKSVVDSFAPPEEGRSYIEQLVATTRARLAAIKAAA